MGEGSRSRSRVAVYASEGRDRSTGKPGNWSRDERGRRGRERVEVVFVGDGFFAAPSHVMTAAWGIYLVLYTLRIINSRTPLILIIIIIIMIIVNVSRFSSSHTTTEPGGSPTCLVRPSLAVGSMPVPDLSYSSLLFELP